MRRPCARGGLGAGAGPEPRQLAAGAHDGPGGVPRGTGPRVGHRCARRGPVARSAARLCRHRRASGPLRRPRAGAGAGPAAHSRGGRPLVRIGVVPERPALRSRRPRSRSHDASDGRDPSLPRARVRVARGPARGRPGRSLRSEHAGSCGRRPSRILRAPAASRHPRGFPRGRPDERPRGSRGRASTIPPTGGPGRARTAPLGSARAGRAGILLRPATGPSDVRRRALGSGRRRPSGRLDARRGPGLRLDRVRPRHHPGLLHFRPRCRSVPGAKTNGA